MNKPLRVISVDGTRGSGKTSQINMLSRLMMSLKLPFLVVKPGSDELSTITALKESDLFLQNTPNGVVIMDGSVARPMVLDLIAGTSPMVVIDRFKHTMHNYEILHQKYNIASLLFVMDNAEKARERLAKKSVLEGNEGVNIKDTDVETELISGMRTFNNHIASKNIKFHTFNLEPSDSIMAIHEQVKKYLYQNYDIPVLPRNDNDW